MRIINAESLRPKRAEVLYAFSLTVCELHQISNCLLRFQSEIVLDIAIEF